VNFPPISTCPSGLQTLLPVKNCPILGIIVKEIAER
jgi:hypothetical protein